VLVLYATALEHLESGKVVRDAAPPLFAFLSSSETTPVTLHWFLVMSQTLT
jgi:hypothetical protein